MVLVLGKHHVYIRYSNGTANCFLQSVLKFVVLEREYGFYLAVRQQSMITVLAKLKLVLITPNYALSELTSVRPYSYVNI